MQPVASLEEIKIPLGYLNSLVTPEIKLFSTFQFVCILLKHGQNLLCSEHHIAVICSKIPEGAMNFSFLMVQERGRHFVVSADQ